MQVAQYLDQLLHYVGDVGLEGVQGVEGDTIHLDQMGHDGGDGGMQDGVELLLGGGYLVLRQEGVELRIGGIPVQLGKEHPLEGEVGCVDNATL